MSDTCTCTTGQMCEACKADLALLPSLRLPEGWSTKFNPMGRLGGDTILYDAAGEWVGCYGYVNSRREDAAAGYWECHGRRMRSQQDCIDTLAAGRAA